MAVVFHHVAVYYRYLTTGVWSPPVTRFYQLIGPLGVSGFFIITGYLFWGRLIRDGGHAKWKSFYIGRLFRISPLYLVAVSTMLVLVVHSEHFHIVVPASKVAKELARWLSLGFLAGFTLDDNPLALVLMAGVTWSIQWEWFFYLSLPLIAFAARYERLRVPFLGVAYACCVICARLTPPPAWSHEYERLVALFLMGMLCATLGAHGGMRRLPDLVSSILIVVLAGSLFLVSEPYSFRAGLVLGCIFYLITSGSTLFGILTSRPARRLGDISYGIYLLQGLALAAVFSTTWAKTFALASPLHYWTCAFAAATLLLILATIAHVLIERPGIALGRRIARKHSTS